MSVEKPPYHRLAELSAVCLMARITGMPVNNESIDSVIEDGCFLITLNLDKSLDDEGFRTLFESSRKKLETEMDLKGYTYKLTLMKVSKVNKSCIIRFE